MWLTGTYQHSKDTKKFFSNAQLQGEKAPHPYYYSLKNAGIQGDEQQQTPLCTTSITIVIKILIKLSSQLLSAIAVSFGATIVGGWMSFSSVALPKMMNGTTPGDPIQIDLFLGSWIASLFFIGNIIGCLAGGLINQVRHPPLATLPQSLGARTTFLLCSPLAAITWVMVALSHHVWVILLSRQEHNCIRFADLTTTTIRILQLSITFGLHWKKNSPTSGFLSLIIRS